MLNLRDFRGLGEEIPIDTSETQPRFLLIAKNGRHIKLSPGAYHLVKGVHDGLSFEALAQVFSEKGGRRVSAAEVEAAYHGVADQLTNISGKEEGGALPGGFWFRRRLIPSAAVSRLSSYLALAYHPGLAFCALSFITVALWWLLRGGLPLQFAGTSLWAGYFLFIVSLLVHELGHASACARYGAEPSDIGFTMYLVYPAFYSDVTAAWRLRRWQRVIVDLGGSYFQFCVAGVFAVVYLRTDWEPFRAAVVMILYGTLFSLNPIFRLDGYWMLADALGVTNLSRQPALITRRAFDKLRGRQSSPFPWPRWVGFILTLYTPAVFLVWGYFVWHLLPFLISSTSHYPESVAALWRTFNQEGPTVSAWKETATLLATSLILGMVWYGTWRMAQRWIVAPLKWLQKARARPDEASSARALEPHS